MLYARRAHQQARRMLILIELDSDQKLMFSSSCPALFFPASWLNWAQLSPHTMMEVENIDLIDKVRQPHVHGYNSFFTYLTVFCMQEYAASGNDKKVSMTSVATAVKYAGMNRTPTQMNNAAPRPRSNSKANKKRKDDRPNSARARAHS